MRYCFDNVVVDSEQMTLVKGEQLIECEPKVFALLVFFCRHPNEAITRAKLVEKVWGGRTVSDAAVNRAVGQLRKLIELDPARPNFIKTVSKVGYRFAISNLLEQPSSTLKTTNQNLKSHSLYTKLVLASLVLSFIVILFYWLNSQKGELDTLKVSKRTPLTSVVGSAFNPSYHELDDTLYYLYRESAKDFAQIHRRTSTGIDEPITRDSFYYTDVTVTQSGKIYAARLNNLEDRVCEIVQVEPISGAVTLLFDCNNAIVTQLVFNERDNRLIFRIRDHIAQPYRIVSFQIDTNRLQQLTHPIQTGNGLGDYIVALSNDTQTLAVIEYKDNGKDALKLFDLKSSQLISEQPFIDSVIGLVWLDNKTLLVSQTDGLYAFNLAEQAFVNIESSDQFGRLIKGKGEQSIITERSHQRVNIYAHYIDTGNNVALTKSAQVNSNPVLGNRSNALAFVSTRGGQRDIYIKSAGMDSYRVDFDHKINYISALAWSDDDKFLLASINSSLFIYSLTEKSWRQLTPPELKVHHVSNIQTDILYSAEVDGQWNIWRLAKDTNKAKQVTFKGGYSAYEDEFNVYYTKFNTAGLYQQDKSTGIETKIIDKFAVKSWRHWQVIDGLIIFLENDKVYSYNHDDNVTLLHHEFLDDVPDTCAMSVHREFIACSVIEDSASNLWQVELTR